MLTDEELTALVDGWDQLAQGDCPSWSELTLVIAQAREANKLRAENETWQRINSDVNAAINRAGIHCAVTFAEAIDMIAKQRDEARAELHAAQQLLSLFGEQMAEMHKVVEAARLAANPPIGPYPLCNVLVSYDTWLASHPHANHAGTVTVEPGKGEQT